MLAADTSQSNPSLGMALSPESCFPWVQATAAAAEGREASSPDFEEGHLKGHLSLRASSGISGCLCYDCPAVQLLPQSTLTSLTLLQVLIPQASPVGFLRAWLCPGAWSQELNVLHHVFA